MQNLSKIIKVIFPIFLFLLGWQVLAVSGILNPQFLPSPLAVAREFFELLTGYGLLNDILASIQRVFVGFLIASFLGIVLGIWAGTSRFFSFLITPILEVIRPIPPIAWIPLAILWFGLGNAPAYFLVALGAFFPIFTNTYFGVSSIDETYRRAAYSLGAGKMRFISDVLFPFSLPHIFAGLKIGLGVGWMVVITAELVGAQSGLGYMIQLNRILLETPRVIVGMVVIGILGFLMNRLMIALERKLIPWVRTS